MKIFITNILIILLSISSLFAQTDFRKGYIVKINGDTLHGYINFQKESLNYSECNFKRFEIAFPVTYSPEKLKAYGIDGEKQYYSAFIDGKTFFLEYLVKGKTSLLYLNKGTQHFFLLEKEGIPVELKSERTTDPKTNQTYNQYTEYLLEKMAVPEMVEPINNSKLEINSLTSLFSQYNKLSNATYEIPYRPKEKNILKDYSILNNKKIQFGILCGLNSFKFASFSSDASFDYIKKADFKPYVSPIFGLFIKANILRNLPNISLQSEAFFQKVSLYGFSNYRDNSFTNVQYFNDLFIDFEALKVKLFLNYSLHLKMVNILPHLGFGYYFKKNPTYTRFSEMYNSSTNIVKSYEYSDLKISNTDLSLIGGLTFEYKLTSARIMSIKLDYETGNKVINNEKNMYTDKILLKGRGTCINITIGLTL